MLSVVVDPQPLVLLVVDSLGHNVFIDKSETHLLDLLHQTQLSFVFSMLGFSLSLTIVQLLQSVYEEQSTQSSAVLIGVSFGQEVLKSLLFTHFLAVLQNVHPYVLPQVPQSVIVEQFT